MIEKISPSNLLEESPRRVVLIATDNLHESRYIGEALEKQGYNVQFCEFDGVKLKGTPISAPSAVLFVFSDYIDTTPKILKALKSHFSPRDIPFIAALAHEGKFDPSIFDSIIFPPAHITQIANRVSSMIRLGQMEREIIRRVETLRKDFDIDYQLSDKMLRKAFRILFIGKASPDFMVIINALQKKNVEVVAAFTSFSAFDFLHEQTFDAVVMNALEQSEPALTISETMRRNPSLFHVPTLFLVDPDSFDDHDLAYQKGARDIISSGAPTKEISGRILELANYHRLHTQLKAEFSSIGGQSCIDAQSGAFNADFFSAHLHRLCESLLETEESLSVIAIRVRPNAYFSISEEKINKAFAQIGNMLRNLVRMQDITTRIKPDIFMIAFPEQNRTSLTPVIERISGIVECAAFESGDKENGAFTVSVETVIVEHMGHESSEFLISSALSELTGEPVSSDTKKTA